MYIYVECVLLKFYIFINLIIYWICKTHFVHLILICTNEINIDDEMLENVDTNTYGNKKVDHVIQYRVKCIIDVFFKDENVAVQAKILRSILT